MCNLVDSCAILVSIPKIINLSAPSLHKVDSVPTAAVTGACVDWIYSAVYVYVRAD